jgi:hypothetical protein
MASPRRFLAVFIALGLFLTACSDEEASPTEAGDDLTASDGVDDENDDGGSGDEPTDAPSDPYCALSRDGAALAAAFDPSSVTPAETETFYRELLVLIDEALGVVPQVLADDLGIQRAVLADTIDILDGAGWNLESAVDELTPLFVAPEYLAADESLERFDVEVCGFEPIELVPGEPGDTPDEPSPPAEEPLEIPAELVGYCEASFAASQADDLPFDAGPAEVQAYYEGLLANLDELSRLAPPELEADLQLIRANFVEVVDILAGAGWDLNVGFPLVEEWAADPAIADPMDAAIDRVEGIDADVCGIVY